MEDDAIYDVFFPIEMTHTDENGQVKVQVTEMERQFLSAEYVEKGMLNLSEEDRAKFKALDNSEKGGWILVNHGTVLMVRGAPWEGVAASIESDARGFNNESWEAQDDYSPEQEDFMASGGDY